MRLRPLLLALALPTIAAAAEGAAGMPEPAAAPVVTAAVATAPAWTASDAAAWRARVAAAGTVAPAPDREVRDERCRVGATLAAWASKARLAALAHLSPGALDGSSVRATRNGAALRVATAGGPGAAEADVLIDPVWGGVARGPSGALAAGDEVLVDYRVGLRRIDALVRLPDGREVLRAGQPAQLTPALPAVGSGERLLATVFVDYRQGPQEAEVLPLLEEQPGEPPQATVTSTPASLPATRAKLAAGQPLTVVCWGDSVTEGGDVAPGERFAALLDARLKRVDAQAAVQVIAVGGSNSYQWQPAEYPSAKPHPTRQRECDVARILAAKPDLVVIEFINDQWTPRADLERHYGRLAASMRAAGSEVLFIAPHRNWERDGSLRAVDNRGLVAAVRALGHQGPGVGVADVAGRWERLWRAGVPFPALLANGFNHPDARGHRLYADELCAALGLPPDTSARE